MTDAPPTEAILCTHNAHKVDELAALLAPTTIVPLPDGSPAPVEDADSFTGNARIKAQAGAATNPGVWVVADDSGLRVDALRGDPGVRSARYAGEDATDARNNDQLIVRLAEAGATRPDQRGAEFVCVLVAIAPDGHELVAEGLVRGVIAAVPAGEAGFGYDPLFIPEGQAETFAELGAGVKAQLSHRARAAAELRRLWSNG